MAYSYTDLRPGMIFERDGAPWQVMQADFVRMQQRKAVVQLKIKNLITGTTVTESAHASDSYEEAEVKRLPVVFIYARADRCETANYAPPKADAPLAQNLRNRGLQYWFHEKNDKSKRFLLSSELLGNAVGFLKSGTEVFAQLFNEKIIAVELPPKIEAKVVEAPPSIRGNTSQGGSKMVVIETGANIATPLFIEVGDIIRVNTQTGEYVERIQKG